jgi:hypothetical protein
MNSHGVPSPSHGLRLSSFFRSWTSGGWLRLVVLAVGAEVSAKALIDPQSRPCRLALANESVRKKSCAPRLGNRLRRLHEARGRRAGTRSIAW